MTDTDTGTGTGRPTTEVAVDVGPADAVPLDRGVAVLLPPDRPDGEPRPVAVFRLSSLEPGGPDEWYAVSHVDPATGAPVIARGLVGSVEREGEPVATVASPLHKQRYDLRTGRCLDDVGLALEIFDIAVTDGRLLIGG